MLYTILTVPPELRLYAVDEKRWRSWRRAIWAWIRDNLGGEFGVERTDPAGEDHETWHPHLNLLWVKEKGYKAWLSERQLSELKSAWAEIIGSNRPVDVYHQFTYNAGKLWHWARYIGRTWPEWRKVVPKHITPRWLGKYPKKTSPSKPSCEKCGIAFIGISYETEESAHEAAGLGPEWIQQEFEQRVQAAARRRKRDT